MTTIWVAVIGIIGTLTASWGGQWIAAKREHSKEDLRWTREENRRVLERRATAYSDAISAIHQWHNELRVWAQFLFTGDGRGPDRAKFPELGDRSRLVVASVELLGSLHVAKCATEAVEALEELYDRTIEDDQEAEIQNRRYGVDVDTRKADEAVKKLVAAAREEIENLSGIVPATPGRSSGRTSSVSARAAATQIQP